MSFRLRFCLMLVLAFFTFACAQGSTIKVSSWPGLKKAVSVASPGDRIVVADGVYNSDGVITIDRAGTAAKPIVIAAKTVGGAEIKGAGSFALNAPAAYVVISGFKFTHDLRTVSLAVGVNHCRITRNVFEMNQAQRGRGAYFQVSGDDNEIDHNTFQNKFTEGQMISVQGPGGSGMAQRTWIHHNYFFNFRPSANNCGAIQVGLSSRSLSPSHTLVEYNLFVATRGENEGNVCNKSCNNVYRFNTFGKGSTELSLRHGNFNQVYCNYFIESAGIRFCGDDHLIYSNVFERCRPAINIANGDGIVPRDKLTSHDRPDRVTVAFNTLIDNTTNIMEGNRRNGLGATEITIANNIIQGGGKAASIMGKLANPKWEGNIVWNNNGGAGDMPAGSFISADPKLGANGDLAAGSPAIGKAAGAYAFAKLDVNGQARGAQKDAGAVRFSEQTVAARILTPAEVGPNAPEGKRTLLAAPKL